MYVGFSALVGVIDPGADSQDLVKLHSLRSPGRPPALCASCFPTHGTRAAPRRADVIPAPGRKDMERGAGWRGAEAVAR